MKWICEVQSTIPPLVSIFLPPVPGATHAADSAQVVLAVDGDPWMGFRCTPRVASMLQHLRAGLDTMVTQCVSSNRSGAVAGLHAELVEAVCGLLTTEQPPYPGNATWWPHPASRWAQFCRLFAPFFSLVFSRQGRSFVGLSRKAVICRGFLLLRPPLGHENLAEITSWLY